MSSDRNFWGASLFLAIFSIGLIVVAYERGRSDLSPSVGKDPNFFAILPEAQADDPPPVPGHGVPVVLQLVSSSQVLMPDGWAIYRNPRVIMSSTDKADYFVGSLYPPTYPDRTALGVLKNTDGSLRATIVRVPPEMDGTINWTGVQDAIKPAGFSDFQQLLLSNPGSTFSFDERTLESGYWGKMVNGEFVSRMSQVGGVWTISFGIPILTYDLDCLGDDDIYTLQIKVNWTGITSLPPGYTGPPSSVELMFYAIPALPG